MGSSPVESPEFFRFMRQLLKFPVSARIIPSFDIICVCLKKAKQRPDIEGEPGGQFVVLVRILSLFFVLFLFLFLFLFCFVFFFRKPGENANATGSVTEAGCIGLWMVQRSNRSFH